MTGSHYSNTQIAISIGVVGVCLGMLIWMLLLCRDELRKDSKQGQDNEREAL